MPTLSNPKHDAIALAYFRDPARIGWRAYKAVFTGASDRAAQTAWSRLLKRAEFQARIAELTAAAADAAVMDLREVLAELSKIGRANMRDFVQLGRCDNIVEEVEALTPEQSAAIQELTVETYMDGAGDDAREVKRIKFKLHSKPQALAELLGHHEPKRHEHTGKDGGPIETKEVEITDLEAARRIHFLLTKATRAAAPASAAPIVKPKKGKPDGR